MVDQSSILTVYDPVAVIESSGKSKKYSIKNLHILLTRGFDSKCEFDVTALVPDHDPEFTVDELSVSSALWVTAQDFKYGDKVKIVLRDHDSGGDQLLFVGYVKTSGSVVSTASNALATQVKVTLATAPYFYDNEWAVMPYSFNNDYLSIPLSTVATSIYETESLAEITDFNIAEYVANLLDHVLSTIASNESSKDWSELKDFIDIKNAPKLRVSPQAQGDCRALQSRVRAIVIQSLDKSSGVNILSQILGSMQLTLTPVFSKDSLTYRVIQDCGILKPDSDEALRELNNTDILSFTEYCAQKRAGTPTNVVVRWVINPTMQPAVLMVEIGYTETGRPQCKIHTVDDIVKREGNKESAGGPHVLTQLGRHTVVSLPAWSIHMDEGALKNLAMAMAKSTIGSGGGFAGSVGISCPVGMYETVKNWVGSVVKLNLTGAPHRIADPIRYGRLIGVEYRLSSSPGTINASLVLTLDCVLNEEDFNTFSVKSKDLLCTYTKTVNTDTEDYEAPQSGQA